jgi:putative methionine-R-sulfoxide reductase with GAF domain
MILLLDAANQKLYAVASRGYEASGVGAEIALGDGVIGVAAQARTPIRIGYMAPEYAYRRAIREATAQSDLAHQLATEIPFAGLAEPHSQLAVPIMALRQLIGVLYVESAEDQHFSYDDEDALVAVTGQLGFAIHALQINAETSEEPSVRVKSKSTIAGAPVIVRHFAENDSVFLDDTYLIKGVAGAIFWTLVRDLVHMDRSEFTNRELRLDQRIRLPDVSDNLEARLILLERRLEEHKACVRLVKTGRGRFRLQADRPLQLVDIPAGRR